MDSDERRLAIGLAMLSAFLVAELIAALFAGSLALLADAGHLVTDVLAMLAAVVAGRLARRPARGHWTFGLARAEILSAAINGVTLLVVAALVLVEGIRRLVHPDDVAGGVVVGVSVAGLAVNLVIARVLSGGHDRHSMNVAGVVAHVVTDAYSFAATLISGIVVAATGFRRADAIASLLLVVLLVFAARGLLAQSGRVLLEAAPSDVDLELVRSHLLGAPEVTGIHDLHIWTVASGLPALSVHVVVDTACFDQGRSPQLLDHLQGCLAGHFDVEHSTFQIEPAGHTEHEAVTHA